MDTPDKRWTRRCGAGWLLCMVPAMASHSPGFLQLDMAARQRLRELVTTAGAG